MATTPYNSLAEQQAETQRKLQEAQRNQTSAVEKAEKARKRNETVNIGVQSLQAANNAGLFNSGVGSGVGAGTSTVGVDTNIGAALNPGVDPGTGFTLGAETGAPVEAGTPNFQIGAPSTAGYIAGAMTAYNTGKNFFGSTGKNMYGEDRDRMLSEGVAMTVANVYTAGLASVAKMALTKVLGEKKMGQLQKIVFNKYTDPIMQIGELTGSSKNRDQFGRDAVRKNFKKQGFVDEAFNVTLGDGSKYNIGVDGKAKPEYGVNPDTGKAMNAFDLNHTDPLVKKLVPMVNPLINVMTGGNEKLASDFTGYLVRAAMSNAGGDEKKAMQNVQAFYAQLKASPTALNAALDKMVAEKKLDAQTALIYKNDIKKATQGMNFGEGGGTGGSPGGVRVKYPSTPKPAPQPYQGQTDVAGDFARRQESLQPKQGIDTQALYSNFAKNFVPQSQSIGRVNENENA